MRGRAGSESDVEVRRGAERFRTRTPWLDSRHSFSYGPHYDPANTSFGPLVVHNDDVVQPDAGFDPHPHAGVEIVTWVLVGELAHTDSAGHERVVRPGVVQRLWCGDGVVHGERNAGGTPVRYVQSWLLCEDDGEPEYGWADAGDALLAGPLVTVASGFTARPDHAVALRTPGAALHVARLDKGDAVALPEAELLHAFVARGGVALDGVGRLAEGDAVRLTGGAARAVTASAASELLVWQLSHVPHS